MNKSYLSIIFLLTFFSFVIPVKSYAGVSCQPIYGGGQTCVTTGNVIINKKVINPADNTFVDNLGINDPKYQPGFIVNFRLEATNTGNTTINRVDVKDIFPQYIEFSSGPGNFDQNTKILTFSMDNLAPNETRPFIVIGRVVSPAQLPAGNGIVCVVNQAIAVTNDNGNSQDNAQLCIENKVPAPVVTAKGGQTVLSKGGFPVLPSVPVSTTPATGPEMLGLIALIPTGLAGWFLRKKSGFKNRKEKN